MTKSVNSNKSSAEKFSKFVDSPLVYVIAVISAIAFYVDFSRGSDSIVYTSMMFVRETLIDLGYKGLRTTVKEMINFESDYMKWTVCTIAVILNIALMVLGWRFINGHGKKQEAYIPSSGETKSFTTRLSPEAYEF